MASLLIQEAVNLFIGDKGPDNSKYLNLTEMKLPDLEELMATHHAGGSWGEVEIGGLGMKALKPTFKLGGWDPQALSQFGLGSKALLPYTVYSAIRDKRDNSLIEVKAVIRGRMAKISTSAHKRGTELTGHDFEICEVMHYELYFAQQEKYWWDFFKNDWRVDGVSQVQDVNAILRIA